MNHSYKIIFFVSIGVLLLLNLVTLGLYFNTSSPNTPSSSSTPNKTGNVSNDTTYSEKIYASYQIPEKMDFCGEEVPLKHPYVRDKFDNEFARYIHLHSKTLLSLKRAQRWFPQIEPILKEEGIPDDFKYLAVAESSLILTIVSKAYAVGFWQFLKGTGREYDLEVNEEVDERYHPIKATRAACQYLKDAYRKFGNWTCAAASYNMGVAGLKKQMEWQRTTSFYDTQLNPETARYLYAIITIKELMQNPEKYGYPDIENQGFPVIPFNEIEVTQSIPDLVAFAQQQGISYHILREYNPWIRGKSLTIKSPDKTYTILIPKVYSEKGFSPFLEASSDSTMVSDTMQ